MNKTKHIILVSAIEILGKNINASLDDIAVFANISRRTLHRHFSGREDLINSVLAFLLEEYLENIKKALRGRVELTHKLNSLLINDIESANKYLVFSQLRDLHKTNYTKDNPQIKELLSIYFQLFEQLKVQEKVSDPISLEWLKVFYSAVVEAAIKSIQAGQDKDECLKMAWLTLWNGIKQN